ncbi:VRR-NUC domain-containing protein [Crucibulum laeve]|uniref:Fanconi-associated nuclease n=1 Tax=Crucibulum laeve TaxID=68775 RepID=A0A5C3LT43_9AGAR|nr:VRR-NUC domain-containing protein [Crucibulum laeve]
MAGNASPRRLIQTLIFGAYTVDKDVIEQDLDRRDEESRAERAGNGTAGSRRPSAYLDCMEQMINTVFTHEKHLLTDQEWSVFSKFASLSYDTRYVISRLVLRKPNQWLAVLSPGIQKYKGEIGETGLQVAIEHLCRPLDDLLKDEDTKVDVLVKQEDEREVIDLTLDSDDEDVQPTTPIPLPQINALADPSASPTAETVDSVMNALFEADADELKVDYLCESEEHMSQEEILNRLTVDQLKLLLKRFKCTPKNPTPTMISSLLHQTTTQSVLGFLSTKSPKGKGKVSDDHLRQMRLPFAVKKFDHNWKGKSQNQEARLKEMSMQMLGKCVRVNYNFYRLVRRLHIINFRSTEHPTSLLLPALLTRFNKRVYPEYSHARNGAIWATREDLLKYEQALALEARIDELLEAIDADTRAKAKTPTPSKRDRFITLVPPAAGGSSATPLKTPVSASTARRTTTSGGVTHKMEVDEGEIYEVSDTPTIQKAKILKEIYEKWIKTLWEGAVMAKQEQSMERTPALERFEPGYVYTRVANKTANAYGSLKEYQAEFDTIQALLSQRFWRRGKRGKWYKRRALIQTDYLSKDPNVPKVKDRNILVQAYDGLLEALNDEDTGLVWRPNLVSRIRKLEKVLKIPEPVEVQDKLRKAESITIKAARVPAVQLDGNGRPVKGKENTPPAPGETISSHFSPIVKKPDVPEFTKPKPKTGKSSWKGRDGEIVNVETRALEYYEDQGFKGFHSETRILTTLFALLFWDVIFTDIPGAFETAYQSAPLDMAEDSFYHARKDLIDARLRDIKSGKAREILEKHDEKYREKNVWCIGVRWDMCERCDLVEIVECLGGPSLATICRLFCEDYAGRNSGVPDLIVWNAEKRLCKFVEVKGPGDRPQENQKLWFDTLLGASAAVEVCLVVDEKEDDKPSTTRKRKRETPATSSTQKSKKIVKDIESEDEGELDYDQLEQEESDDHKLPALLSKHRRTEAPEGYVEKLSLPFPSKATPLRPPASTPVRRVNRVQVLTTNPIPIAGSC